MAEATSNVGTTGLAYRGMEQAGEWDLLSALKGGTRTMRTTRWLPMNPREKSKAYEYRREQSYLFPGYASALGTLCSLPFAKPLTVNGKDALDPRLAKLEDDCDREGTRLHDFAHMADEEGATFGLVHILVDYPAQATTPTKLDDEVGDVRPYFVLISPRNLIGWREVRNAAGKKELASVRIKETRIEPSAANPYEEEKVEYVREIGASEWRLWRKPPGGDGWLVAAEGAHSFGSVPLVTVYYNQTGDMTAMPPLLDLAWTNLRHFNSESTQEVALTFARIPILFGRGFTADEARAFNDVGPGAVCFTADASAQLSSVEHTGASIQAGRDHGKDLIEQMIAMGAQPLVEQASATATGEARQDRRATSQRQEWCNALQNGLFAAYRLAAEVLGVELPKDFSVSLNGDFVLSAQAALHLQALQMARATGDLSHGTFIAELKKRGVLGANVDAEEEREKVESEGPALSDVTDPDPEPDPEPEDDQEPEGENDAGTPPPKPTKAKAA